MAKTKLPRYLTEPWDEENEAALNEWAKHVGQEMADEIDREVLAKLRKASTR